MNMRTKGAGSEGGLPTTTIVIIAIVVMVIATLGIFLALPYFEEQYGDPGKCDDTCYLKTEKIVATTYMDCDISARMIVYYPNGPSGDHTSYKWHYQDYGYTTYYDPKDIQTLGKLIDRVTTDYNNGVITENSYHWFMCTAEAID